MKDPLIHALLEMPPFKAEQYLGMFFAGDDNRKAAQAYLDTLLWGACSGQPDFLVDHWCDRLMELLKTLEAFEDTLDSVIADLHTLAKENMGE